MRGDLDLIVEQQSLTGFDVKLTPMGSWSVLTVGNINRISPPPINQNSTDRHQ